MGVKNFKSHWNFIIWNPRSLGMPDYYYYLPQDREVCFPDLFEGIETYEVSRGRFSKNDQLSRIKEYAESKGGQCLSTEYIQAHDKLKWKCSNPNHEPWFASYHKVVNHNSWCSYCSNRKLTKKEALEKAKNHAELKGGKCLSTEYVNAHSRMKWECKNGHQWETRFSRVISENTWCPKCKRN